jgi:hypothetical protein
MATQKVRASGDVPGTASFGWLPTVIQVATVVADRSAYRSRLCPLHSDERASPRVSRLGSQLLPANAPGDA